MRTVALALAATHIGWGVAFLLDARLTIQGYMALAAVHFAAGALLLHKKGTYLGGAVSTLLLIYYWIYVKPLAPIAEPQSVGLIAVSLAFLTRLEAAKRFMGLLRIRDDYSAALLLARLGLAYPFLEWGLDALRNPRVFYRYISGNRLAYLLASPLGVEAATFLIFVFEVLLAILLVSGFKVRASAAATLLLLILFSVVAAYPLALPQDISLAAGAILLAKNGGGKYGLDGLLTHPLKLIVGVDLHRPGEDA